MYIWADLLHTHSIGLNLVTLTQTLKRQILFSNVALAAGRPDEFVKESPKL
jgi:hypothetical protein